MYVHPYTFWFKRGASGRHPRPLRPSWRGLSSTGLLCARHAQQQAGLSVSESVSERGSWWQGGAGRAAAAVPSWDGPSSSSSAQARSCCSSTRRWPEAKGSRGVMASAVRRGRTPGLQVPAASAVRRERRLRNGRTDGFSGTGGALPGNLLTGPLHYRCSLLGH
jgi:hypothetical protein